MYVYWTVSVRGARFGTEAYRTSFQTDILIRGPHVVEQSMLQPRTPRHSKQQLYWTSWLMDFNINKHLRFGCRSLSHSGEMQTICFFNVQNSYAWIRAPSHCCLFAVVVVHFHWIDTLAILLSFMISFRESAFYGILNAFARSECTCI